MSKIKDGCEVAIFLALAFALFVFGLTIENENVKVENKTSDISYESGENEYEYIKVVYLGSSDCGFSNSDSNHESVISIKESMQELSFKFNFKLMFTGVSTDTTAHAGIRYLSKTGPYDEIVSGGDIYNVGLFNHVWNKDGSPSTPQLHILLEKYKIIEREGTKYGVIKDVEKTSKVIRSALGQNEIQELNSIIDRNGWKILNGVILKEKT